MSYLMDSYLLLRSTCERMDREVRSHGYVHLVQLANSSGWAASHSRLRMTRTSICSSYEMDKEGQDLQASCTKKVQAFPLTHLDAKSHHFSDWWGYITKALRYIHIWDPMSRTNIRRPASWELLATNHKISSSAMKLSEPEGVGDTRLNK